MKRFCFALLIIVAFPAWAEDARKKTSMSDVQRACKGSTDSGPLCEALQDLDDAGKRATDRLIRNTYFEPYAPVFAAAAQSALGGELRLKSHFIPLNFSQELTLSQGRVLFRCEWPID